MPKFNLAGKPNIPNIEEFKAFVAEKIGNTTKLEPQAYKDLYRKYYQEIVTEWEESGSLANLPLKVFNKIPVISVLSFDSRLKLIGDNKFRRAWLILIAKQRNARHARKTYRAVFRNYDSYQPYLEQIFNYVRPLIRSAALRSCKKLAALDDRYDLLNPEIIKNIADYILHHRDKPSDEILLAIGIGGSLQEAEISAAVGKELLARNFACLQHGDDSILTRTLEYFQNDTDDTLRFNYMRNDILKSLLENYLEQDPPAEIKAQIEAFTDRYLGDPRGNPRWQGVDAEIRQVVARWKIEVTLRVFFALLDYVAKTDSTHARHWQERKEFWRGYLDAGKIAGAWVVLGKRYLSHHDLFNTDNLKFAKFSASAGIQSSHCAIIMQINNFVLTEWSHVGALRIWQAGAKRVPKLYKDEYQPTELKNMNLYEEGCISHIGNWQERARSILDAETTFRRW